MNSIIQYLLIQNQYLLQIISFLFKFICKYIPLRQWIFDDSNSPEYQKFKVDEPPLIEKPIQVWYYKDFLAYIKWKYEPFYKTMKEKNVSTYKLITQYNVSRSLIDRLKHNKPISTVTLNDLCKIMGCKVEDVLVYIED